MQAPLLAQATRPDRAHSCLEDAWLEPVDQHDAQLEDFSSIIFTLHAWSYRLTQKEFAHYEERAKLSRAARSFDHRHLSALFARPGRQQQQQQQAGVAASPCSSSGGGGSAAAPQRYNTSTARSAAAPALLRSSSGRVMSPRAPRTFLQLPVRPVNHPFLAAWSVLLLFIDMTYTALLLPAAFAFDQVTHPGSAAWWVSVAIGFLFLGDMLVVLHRGVVVRYLDRHIYVDNPADVAHLYVFHGTFWTDLPVAISGPLQLLTLLPALRSTRSSGLALLVHTFILLRGLRLIKLLLLSRELFFGRAGFRHLGTGLHRWYLLSLVYVLGVLINWLACIMLTIAQHEGRSNSWLADVKGHDLTNAPPLQQYMAAFYWMLISCLTVGYGDISAVTAAEQGAVVLAVLVGVLFIGYAVKSMMDIMVEAAVQDEGAQRLSILRERAGEVKVWAQWTDMPGELVDPMFKYFMGPWLTTQVVARHWGNVLQDLPALLRGQVLECLLLERHKGLAPLGARLLHGIPFPDVWHVLALLQPRPLAPGQQLCWAGEPAEFLWLLQEGSVASLVGVVPDPATINDVPGLIVAFDAAVWLRQFAPPPSQQQQQQQGGRRQGKAAAEPAPQQSPQLCYTASYQSVAHTSFCWALPLRTLGLALQASPQLLANVRAEVLGAAAAAAPAH